MKKLCVYAILLAGLLGGVALAQVPDMQRKDTTDTGEPYLREHLALPSEILRLLLDEKKTKEAVTEYEKFRKTAQADALDLFLLDAEVYGTAASIEPAGEYGKMRDEAVRKMVEQYPDNAEAIMRTVPVDGKMRMDLDKTLEVLNKAIEVDSTYLPAYEQRCFIYREKKMMKEACMDYLKLPKSVKARMGMEMECQSFAEERK